MITTDYYLKMDSEADMPTVLSAFYKQDYLTVVDEETGEPTEVPEGDPYLVKNTPDYAIDVVGIIREPTGNMLTHPSGIEYPETAPVPGWHVNIRLIGDKHKEDLEAISQYIVQPPSPSRVFF